MNNDPATPPTDLARPVPLGQMTLEERHRLYEAALSSTPDLVYVFDLEYRFLYANEGLLRMWGRTWEEAIGKTCLELGYEPWHADMHSREIDQVVATRQPIRGEVPFMGTFGKRYYDYIFVPVFDAAGKVTAVAGTTRDVTERIQLATTLERQARELREADRRKDEFLAMLAHELRNPLASVNHAVSLLMENGSEAESRQWSTSVIQRQTAHLARLVDDLLDVSRITRGRIELRKELLDAREVVENATHAAMPMLVQRGQTLVSTFGEHALWLEADRTRLEQIVVNLLTNAAKYSNAGDEIRVDGERVKSDEHGREEIVLTVSDHGQGIEPEKIPEMFELFAQGERSAARAEGGLGIGLTVVRRLCELHDGSVTAHSEGPGKGSTFTVRLPAAPVPVVPRGASPETSGKQTKAGTGTSAAAAATIGRILIVDDNVDTAMGLARLLHRRGYETRLLHDGTGALEAVRAFQPAVVLLDIGLPGMDGHAVAAALRAEPDGGKFLIVALSGYGQEADVARARTAGCDHYLVKPVELEELYALLRGEGK